MDTPRSIVISFNWQTKEILHTIFEGVRCIEEAYDWAGTDSFLWEDFPREKGWDHFVHLNEAALLRIFDEK